jgi:hypothetical protein
LPTTSNLIRRGIFDYLEALPERRAAPGSAARKALRLAAQPHLTDLPRKKGAHCPRLVRARIPEK